MLVTWKSCIVNHPELRDINNWPNISIESIEKHKRKLYLRNLRIVSSVLTGESQKEVAEMMQVSKSTVTRLLQRSLSFIEGGMPQLTAALIPNSQIAKRHRRAELNTHGSKRGDANSFYYLLDNVPTLKDKLDQFILAKLKDSADAQTLMPKWFHGEFKRILAEMNWPKDTYPYTSSSLAYESVRQYFHKRVNELLSERLRLADPIFETMDKSQNLALREVHIDEQITDIQTTIYIEYNDELVPLRVARVSLILMADSDSDCYLGYHLALSKAPTQQDMLTLINNVLSRWKPLNLTTPKLKYTIGACFPSALGGNFANMVFNHIKLDNALIHLANSVRSYFCEHQGATVNLGKPYSPKSRNWVEHAFNATANQISHRFASTTGSSSSDKIKESRKNKKKPPAVTLNAFNEMLSVMLTHHNIKPQARLGGATPLETITKNMDNGFSRLSYTKFNSTTSPLIDEKIVPVKFLVNENRAPFINFYKVRYSGKCLRNPSVLQSKIRIKFNRMDIRTLEAFTLDGEFLGTIYAPKSWRRFKHSIHTRQLINKLTKDHTLQDSDPLSGYAQYLLDRKKQPKYALQLARLASEASIVGEKVKSPTKHKTSKKSEWVPYRELINERR